MPQMKEFTEQADSTQAELRIGESFEVALQENPSTGFRWALRSNGVPVCILTGDFFSGERARPGATGVHRWKFKVVASGSATIEMDYVRRWETAPPARTFKLHLRAGG
jgi:inhibitor of cysteine peptidase